jgi:hypothetical protein
MAVPVLLELIGAKPSAEDEVVTLVFNTESAYVAS